MKGAGLTVGWRRASCAAAGIAIGTLFVSGTAGAQTADASRSASFDINAVQVMTPPVIDGEVGDNEWEGATAVTSFIQYEPRRGDRSDSQTEAVVLYDAGHLYVAFRAWDTEPVTAQLTQRDADLLRDDAVVVVVDTTNDRRSGYYFITNVLGTQADGRIADDGRTSEPTWDAPWQSAARRTDYGWSAEFSIPLSSVRYAAGERQTWGINLGRSRRRTLEMSFWSGPLDNQWRVSEAGRLLGLTVPPPLDRIQVVPFGLTRLQDGVAPHGEAGIDARYALTPTTALYGTLFPDFATIEADQEQVNLTRFEVSLREKRQFFLEGQEQFNRLSTRVSWTEEFKLFEKDFRNRQVGFDVGYNTREYESVRMGLEFGRNFDADYVLWTASARHKVTSELSAEYSLERLVRDPDPERQGTWIHVLRTDQFFTKDLFLRLFFQTNSAIDRRNIQAVFVYRYLPPFGTIQAAYQRGTAAFGERSTQGDTLFLKATTMF